jgi:hypothetical protein
MGDDSQRMVGAPLLGDMKPDRNEIMLGQPIEIGREHERADQGSEIRAW